MTASSTAVIETFENAAEAAKTFFKAFSETEKEERIAQSDLIDGENMSIEVDNTTAQLLDSSMNSDRSLQRGLRVLFLSSDTGGGHRASAEALAKQFQLLFPGTTYDLLDVVEKDGVPPYNSLVSYYKHLSARPTQWKLVYSVSNSRAFEMLADAHLKLMCERAVRRSILSYQPDVVISVHPLMTNVPVLSCSKISHETGRHLPIFTVVTDLGSAHCLWFANGVEKMFVGSQQVKELAKVRGKVPEEKLIELGLPIRPEFAEQAEKLGDRMSSEGILYQRQVRRDLELPCDDHKTILVMGGGEGVGALSNVVDALYVELVLQGINALVLVVCGRNQKLKKALDERKWLDVFKRWRAARERQAGVLSLGAFTDTCDSMAAAGCIESSTVTGSIRRMLSRGSLTMNSAAVSVPLPSSPISEPYLMDEKKAGDVAQEAKPYDNEIEDDLMLPTLSTDSVECQRMNDDFIRGKTLGCVKVVGLGFVTRMAEYMVAADVLVSKAGPGTIVEAAALSLPILLTSYLPGQEEGNVDYVVDGGFGAYCLDSDPIGVAEEVCMWLTDDKKRASLSRAAKAHGRPFAARDIAKMIGESTIKWIEHNDEMANAKVKVNKEDMTVNA